MPVPAMHGLPVDGSFWICCCDTEKLLVQIYHGHLGHVYETWANSRRRHLDFPVEIAAALAAGKIDWITVTSSAIARSLVGLFGDDLERAKLAAISPLTADVLSAAGYSPTVVAEQYTTEGLLYALGNG